MVPIKVVIADDHTLFREGLKRILSLEKDILVVGEASADARRLARVTREDKRIFQEAASLEGRSPFLDHEIVEWSARVPDHFKVHGRSGKYLLRIWGEKLTKEQLARTFNVVVEEGAPVSIEIDLLR